MSEARTARSIEGKVCLVTGATAGLGLVTARALARAGASTIASVGERPLDAAETLRALLIAGHGSAPPCRSRARSERERRRRLSSTVA